MAPVELSPPLRAYAWPHRSTLPLAKRDDDYLYGRTLARVLYYERLARYSNTAFLHRSIVTLAISAFTLMHGMYTVSTCLYSALYL